MVLANTIPGETLKPLVHGSKEARAELEGSRGAIKDTVHALLDLQARVASGFPDTCMCRKNIVSLGTNVGVGLGLLSHSALRHALLTATLSAGMKRPAEDTLDSLWDTISERYESLQTSFLTPTVDKWNAKTRIVGKQKKFKALDKTVMEQIEQV